MSSDTTASITLDTTWTITETELIGATMIDAAVYEFIALASTAPTTAQIAEHIRLEFDTQTSVEEIVSALIRLTLTANVVNQTTQFRQSHPPLRNAWNATAITLRRSFLATSVAPPSCDFSCRGLYREVLLLAANQAYPLHLGEVISFGACTGALENLCYAIHRHTGTLTSHLGIVAVACLTYLMGHDIPLVRPFSSFGTIQAAVLAATQHANDPSIAMAGILPIPARGFSLPFRLHAHDTAGPLERHVISELERFFSPGCATLPRGAAL